MNIFKYMASRGYRNRFSEEYSKEFINRFELPEQEYEKIYKKSRNDESSNGI